MSFNIHLWGVENGLLAELPKERLDTEDRLEQWIGRSKRPRASLAEMSGVEVKYVVQVRL